MKKNNRQGFTMAELLIVIAIIGILSGVAFVAVQNHQKSLAQLECDTIAKEIFFAAQNHLTMAESQGYLGENVAYGTPTDYALSDGTNAKDVYYFGVNGPGAFTGNSVLDLMLPFGSIDDSVRTQGNYVIRYQAKPARVLDVFYGRSRNAAYTGKYDADPTAIAPAQLWAKNYGGKVIGWYGGDSAMESGKELNAPYIEVENAEKLTVRIKTASVNVGADGNPILTNADGSTGTVSVKLIIKGEKSQAMAAIPVLPAPNQRVTAATGDAAAAGFDYVVTLDDITTAYQQGSKDGGHFGDITTDMASATSATNPAIDVAPNTAFLPGENITVQAVAFSNNALASIAYSNEWTTNSLFADVVDPSEVGLTGLSTGSQVALIANMRHLANLDRSISGVNADGTTASFSIGAAKQTADLIWKSTGTPAAGAPKAFTTAIPNASVYKKGAGTGTAQGCWQPVSIDYPLAYYDASEAGAAAATDTPTVPTVCHSITGVVVATTDEPAGLFGELKAAVKIENLELIDFDISSTGSGNAGALAGTLTGGESAKVEVENVLAHNSETFDKLDTATVKANTGAAGGLVGKMTGAEVVQSAAVLVVNSTGGNAGGLVGESNGGKIESSYAGGHTHEGGYTKNGAPFYNVTGGKSAGGLLGGRGTDTGYTPISCSYSTCSVSGKIAGGLAGSAGGSISHCYATGLVSGTDKAGAFAGEYGGTPTDCHYYQIVNEQMDATTKAFSDMPPVHGAETLANITALDATAEDYNTFSGNPSDWQAAQPIDATLKSLFRKAADSDEVQYNFKTVEQLGDTTIQKTATATLPADFVAVHHGDWPAPETLVVNTK